MFRRIFYWNFWRLDWLSDHLSNRRNNFTLIRFLLAVMVLYGHSFALAAKSKPGLLTENIYGTNEYIGGFAVSCFFFISGLFITQSFLRKGDFHDYLWARVQRIYPAAWVCALFCVLVIGPCFTNLRLVDYLTHEGTFKYLAGQTFLWKVEWRLPGVFDTHRNKAVNGSLWTLAVELRCYLMVGLIGVLGGLRKRSVANLTLLALLVLGLFSPKSFPFLLDIPNARQPVAYFLAGSLCLLNARHIPLHPLGLLFLLTGCFAVYGHAPYDILFPITTCYALLFVAYRLPFSRLNDIGDLSYGMYIYAFPCQQMWHALFPSWQGYRNAAASFPTALILAALSWFFIEKKAMAWKRTKPTKPDSKSVAPPQPAPSP